jgi:hypothetical protein
MGKYKVSDRDDEWIKTAWACDINMEMVYDADEID